MKEKTRLNSNSESRLPLENVYELILLLERIRKLNPLDDKWNGHLLLIPVILDEDYFIGRKFEMVYLARSRKGKNLRGMVLNEFLPKFWEFKPELDVLDEIWLFKYSGSGPFANRYKKSRDIKLIQSVKQLILGFKKERAEKIRDFYKNIEALGRNPQKWEKCMICYPIPDKSYAFWKGNELESGGIGPNEGLLEIVGAPHFDDRTSYRHWCIKRCPNCKTCYMWEFDYEYLVNGTEDEITLTRLDEKEERKLLNKVKKILEEKNQITPS